MVEGGGVWSGGGGDRWCDDGGWGVALANPGFH